MLLAAFVSQPGKVFTKSELLDAGWRALAVEEANFTVQIATLRKQLGAKPAGGEWIVTVPRVGYRFISGHGHADCPNGGISPSKPALAVLPFDNMSGDPEQEYFADGVVEDISPRLAGSVRLR